MFYLVIFNVPGEALMIFKGFTEDRELMSKIRACHNQYTNGNCEDEVITDFINEMPDNLPNCEKVLDDTDSIMEVPMLEPHDYAVVVTGQMP